MNNDDEKNYVISLKERNESLREEILIDLMKHCDEKIDRWIKAESKKNAAIRRATERHNKAVEKFLSNQEKLIKIMVKKYDKS